MSVDKTNGVNVVTGVPSRNIRRLLVANRGEIARRVFRTARELGIETVAVFSDPDREAAHVRDADIAVAIGGCTSAESYLDVDKILAAAASVDADAIHPGYGFLSENAEFAERVGAEGLVWIGPTPESIRVMAGKVEAKRLAAAAGVPLVPGAELDTNASDPYLITTAAAVGYPLLVKASAGGGGKGMRLVESEADLLEAVAGARREAQASFGDPTVFFEQYLRGAHHVEVQVFGDRHGNVVHLRERECSIQRRHQKIVEESPAPNATASTLDRMYAAAVSLAESIGYFGAGTVEFMVAGTGQAQQFYFLEMNTRLQVEHPVTEATTTPALDLVAWQLAVATGQPLPLTQDELGWSGDYAIEVRLYAEDPGCGFLPSSGLLVAFADPADAVGFGPKRIAPRYDLSVESGDEITPFYDPMIGKIIGVGATRAEAAEHLATTLAARDIVGITTNRDSLVAILRSPAFLAGDTTTHFIDEHPDLLVPQLDAIVRAHHLIAAALAAAEVETAEQPWRAIAPLGWRNVPAVPARSDWSFAEAGESSTKSVIVDWLAAGRARASVVDADDAAGWTGTGRAGQPIQYRLQLVGSADVEAPEAAANRAGPEARRASAEVELELGGVLRRYRVGIADEWVWVNDGVHSTAYHRVPRFHIHADAAAGSGPSAPVPGTIVAVEVADGDAVEEGQTLVVLEAMKMEHRIVAPVAGTVEEVLVAVGQAVDAHQLLVKLHAPEGE